MNKRIILSVAALGVIFACVATFSNAQAADSSSPLNSPGIVASDFMDGALESDITTEDCTLTNGDITKCYQITVTGKPVDTKIGPFCPTTTSTTAEDSGIWLDGSKIYDADGKFITDLAEIYGDAKWKLYDDSGKVNVTDTKEAFQGAARPDVAEEYKYHCVEGKYEWTNTGKAVPISILVPVTPIRASSPTTSQGADLGVTLNGLVIAASAPVDAILGAYTIAAFDDCGGHFNPIEGYHMHAYTNCEGASYGSKIEDPNAETNQIGYALDGVAVFAPLDHDSTIELDECNGRTTQKDGYHYYAQSPETNRIIKCFMGVTAIDTSAPTGPGGPQMPGPSKTIVPIAVGAVVLLILGVSLIVRKRNKDNKQNV